MADGPRIPKRLRPADDDTEFVTKLKKFCIEHIKYSTQLWAHFKEHCDCGKLFCSIVAAHAHY